MGFPWREDLIPLCVLWEVAVERLTFHSQRRLPRSEMILELIQGFPVTRRAYELVMV